MIKNAFNKRNVFIFMILSLIFYSIIFVTFKNFGSVFLDNALTLAQADQPFLIKFFANLQRIYNNIVIQIIFRLLQFAIMFFLLKAMLRVCFVLENKLRKAVLKHERSINDQFLLKIVFINSAGQLCLALLTIVLGEQLIMFSAEAYAVYGLCCLVVKLVFAFLPYIKKSGAGLFCIFYSVFQIIILIGMVI